MNANINPPIRAKPAPSPKVLKVKREIIAKIIIVRKGSICEKNARLECDFSC